MKPPIVSNSVELAIYIRSGMERLGLTTEKELLSLLSAVTEEADRRALACSLLGARRTRKAVHDLLRVGVEANDGLLEWEAFAAVGAIGSKQATRTLIRLLRSDCPARKRRAVAFALGRLVDKTASGALLKALKETGEDEKVRGFAAEALGMLKPTKSIEEALINATGDASTEVRYSSLCAISALGIKSAAPAVRAMLGDHSLADGAMTVAELAAEVLAGL